MYQIYFYKDKNGKEPVKEYLTELAKHKDKNSRIKFKATPHKYRLTPLHSICLHIFRYLAQKSLDIRQYACGIFIQSNEKSDGASAAQYLCGVALIK